MNLSDISKPCSFPNVSYMLYAGNRDLSRGSLTSKILLLFFTVNPTSYMCWGVVVCTFAKQEDVRVPFLTIPYSYSILFVVSAEEPSSYPSSASGAFLLNLK